MIDKPNCTISTLIENDNTYKRLDSGLYFRSPHEAFGVISELEGVTSELEKKIEIDMNIFKRNLRQSESYMVEATLIDIQNNAAESIAKHVQMASAARKALASLRLYESRNGETAT